MKARTASHDTPTQPKMALRGQPKMALRGGNLRMRWVETEAKPRAKLGIAGAEKSKKGHFNGNNAT